ncbi:MAG: universal stress protein [Rhodococcus sp. (in: high G+C Gram-positive bacteria)]
MNYLAIAIFLASWPLAGLITGLWMTRRGHNAMWIFVAVMLGPLFIPIALERTEHRPRLASSGPNANGSDGLDGADSPRLMVAMDGSPESEHALDTAIRLIGNRPGTLMLAEVVSYDDADEARPNTALVDEATQRLARAAARVTDIPPQYEVLAGPAGEALRHFAEDQSMELVVVGRRGRGFSTRLMGSVSSDLVNHSTVPVLVVEPQAKETGIDFATSTANGPGSSGDTDGLRRRG